MSKRKIEDVDSDTEGTFTQSSEEDDDPGSLVDFITDDDSSEDELTDDEEDLAVQPTNIVLGKRVSRPVIRYEDENLYRLYTEDADLDAYHAHDSDSAPGTDSEDASVAPPDTDEEASEFEADDESDSD